MPVGDRMNGPHLAGRGRPFRAGPVAATIGMAVAAVLLRDLNRLLGRTACEFFLDRLATGDECLADLVAELLRVVAEQRTVELDPEGATRSLAALVGQANLLGVRNVE